MRWTSFRALALTGLVSVAANLGPGEALAAGGTVPRFATNIEVVPAAEKAAAKKGSAKGRTKADA